MSARERLPNRRRNETFEFEHATPEGSVFIYEATVGFYPDGRPGELFLGCRRTGTAMDVGVKDSAIALSLALQHGCPLETIAPTFLRDHQGRAEGPLGAAVDRLVEMLAKPPAIEEAAHV